MAAPVMKSEAELARKMLRVETESKSDRALQYALLDNARKLFAAAGDAELALAAVDSLAGQFELDPWQLKTETASWSRLTEAIGLVLRDPAAGDQS